MDKARQFIKYYTRGCSNELCAVEDKYGKKVISYHEWLTPEQALAAVEIARKELIDKVCEYLRNHIDPQLTIYHEQTWCKRDEFINRFRQAMEEYTSRKH